MSFRHPLATVLIASVVCLAVGFSATPFWDEDEPRFAAIAQAMLDTGDWVVPMYNGTLAVDKPVLMHWCMAVCFALFGTSEIAARLPAALATVATALALLRAGTRWFSVTTGVVAALAYVGCLLVAIESHAATPDSILTALTAWATLLVAEAFLPDRETGAAPAGRLSIPRAAIVGGLLGLAVLCKGPIGYVGPLAVALPWVWWIAVGQRLASTGPITAGRLAAAAVPAALATLRESRLFTITAAMLAVAAPWYVTVGMRTAGAWPAGFFYVHNVGRFAAPMEKHGGSVLYHPLGMLVGFFPWSCFLPLAIVVACWRLWKRVDLPAVAQPLALALFWLAVWVGGFSVAATKLPNYIMPAYPAAALLVAVLGVEAASAGRWPHPGWMASGLGWLAFGGIATAAVVITASFFGLTGAEPAAIVGLVPVAGAIACCWLARREPLESLRAFTITGLVYTALTVGPAGAWMARANALPHLVREAHTHAGGQARLGTFTQNTPNIVFYAHGLVAEWQPGQAEAAAEFLASGDDAVVIVPEHRFDELASRLPEGCGIVGRGRPLFQKHDFLLVGTKKSGAARTAAAGRITR
jgi:4-amino-4-deoxy-L-arabinose transferase-like glycosyltransferase